MTEEAAIIETAHRLGAVSVEIRDGKRIVRVEWKEAEKPRKPMQAR